MTSVDEIRFVVQGYLQAHIDVIELRGQQFFIPFGTTAVSIVCNDWGDENVIVKLMALVLKDVPVSEELYARVGREVGHYVFGTLMLVEHQSGETGDLYFHHTLLGDTLDEEELMFALAAVANTADELDVSLQQEFGGSVYAEERET